MTALLELSENPANLGSAKGTSPIADACARIQSMAKNTKRNCKRVRAWVNNDDCRARYFAALASKTPGNPCLECASVLPLLSKSQRTLAKSAKEATMPAQNISATPQKSSIKPPKLVKKDTFCGEKIAQKTLVETGKTDFFAGLTAFTPRKSPCSRPMAYLTRKLLSFNAQASALIGDAQTVTIYYDNVQTRVLRLFVQTFPGDGGSMRLLSDTKGPRAVATVRTVSAASLVNRLKLAHCIGKHFPVNELQPGVFEIDLREVA